MERKEAPLKEFYSKIAMESDENADQVIPRSNHRKTEYDGMSESMLSDIKPVTKEEDYRRTPNDPVDLGRLLKNAESALYPRQKRDALSVETAQLLLRGIQEGIAEKINHFYPEYTPLSAQDISLQVNPYVFDVPQIANIGSSLRGKGWVKKIIQELESHINTQIDRKTAALTAFYNKLSAQVTTKSASEQDNALVVQDSYNYDNVSNVVTTKEILGFLTSVTNFLHKLNDADNADKLEVMVSLSDLEDKLIAFAEREGYQF